MSVYSRGKIILRFDADEHIGIGHFSRCISLAQELTEIGFEPFVVTKKAHRNILQKLQKNWPNNIRIPASVPWSKEVEFLSQATELEKVQAAVFDISTPYALEDIREVTRCLEAFKRRFPVCLLDSVHRQALYGKLNIVCDLVVVPYLGLQNEGRRVNSGTVFLNGPTYFVFGKEYSAYEPKTRIDCSHEPNQILVSFGGSDPHFITAKVLKALSRIQNRRLSIRIVIGPSFSEQLVNEIEYQTECLDHICSIVEAPDSLLDHMLWCDIAISSSGLTKYELAMTGTPSLQISIDGEHALINTPFAEMGTSVHLGVHTCLTEDQIARSIVDLLEHPSLLQDMSRRGQAMLDSLGARRIGNEIDRLVADRTGC